MKKLLSALWKMPLPALMLVYALTYAFATFKEYQLTSGGVVSEMFSELNGVGVAYSPAYVIGAFIFGILFAVLVNYLLIRIWYRIFTLIYVRTFTKGRAALIRVKLPFSVSQFVTLIFILLVFFNIALGLVRLLYFAGIQYYALVQYVLYPVCALLTTAFGVYIFNKYILPDSVAYNATLALILPLILMIFYM